MSVDIGQVGNKTDSGTVRVVRICVFNFTLVVYICLLRRSFVFHSLSFILTFIFEEQEGEMYSSSQEDAKSIHRIEQSDLYRTATSVEHQQWTSTFGRLFSSYQRYTELRRKDDAIK